ncbi:MAG: beta-ketoacyl synthase N-terminal-like domain-containing protein [Myxococcota bacterium]
MREGGFVDDIERFDAPGSSASPREATSLDPQQRLLLECSWHALEDAGIPADDLRALRRGVRRHRLRRVLAPLRPHGRRGRRLRGHRHETSFAAGRLSYVLGLPGACRRPNTACSLSLVTVHLAVQALRSGQCEIALAGGVNAIVGPENTIWMSMLQALAPDARCKAFDARADGYVRAEGCGMIAPKRLPDALQRRRPHPRRHPRLGRRPRRRVERAHRAQRRGAAARDPRRPGRRRGDRRQHRLRRVPRHRHPPRRPHRGGGAGAVLAADRPRAARLARRRRQGEPRPPQAGAGIAGLLRAVLALKHRTVPPVAHLHTPNSPCCSTVTPPSGCRRSPRTGGRRPAAAGVSSFGISGTNAHIVLEEAPAAPPVEDAAVEACPVSLVTVSWPQRGPGAPAR